MAAIKEAVKKAKKHFEAEEWKLCETVLKEVDASEDTPYLYWVLLGAAQFKLSKAKEAEVSYNKAVAVNDTQLPAWKGLRDVYLGTTKHKASVETLAKIVSLSNSEELTAQSLQTIMEITSGYDMKKLPSATCEQYIGNELQARTKEGRDLLQVPFLGAINADSTAQRCAATASVRRSLIFSVHPQVDELLLNSLTRSDIADTPIVDWAIQRGLNNLKKGATEWTEQLMRLTQRELQKVVDGARREEGQAYMVLKSAAFFADESSQLDDVFSAACHALCPKEPCLTEKDTRIAAGVLAAGRIAAVSDVPRGEVFDVFHLHSAGEWAHLDDASDLEEPIAWLEAAAKECPEVISFHALRSATLYRLGRLSDAVSAAESGLSALSFRAHLSLNEEAVSKWGARLANLVSLGCASGRLAVKARQVSSIAVGVCTELSTRVVRAEVLLATGPPQPAFDALKGASRGSGTAFIAARLTTAKTHLALKEYSLALTEISDALDCAKYTEGQTNPRREVPHILSAKAEVLWQSGGQPSQENAVQIAETVIAMAPSLSRPHCVKGHYYLGKQKRKDTDGNPYSKEEFGSCYGGTKQWVTAGTVERRVDSTDGKGYTKAQFELEYGARCAEWEVAKPCPPTPTEDDKVALTAYTACTTLNPLDPEAAKCLCSMLGVLQQHDTLHSILESVTSAAEDHGGDSIRKFLWAFNLQGFECLKNSRYEQSATCLKHCVRYSNTHVVIYGLGRAYEGMGNYPRALGLYKSIVLGEVQSASVTLAARHGVAACLVREGRLEEAEEVLLEVTAENPGSEASWLLLAKCRWQRAVKGAAERSADESEALLDKSCTAADEAIRCSHNAGSAFRIKGDVCLGGASIVPQSSSRFLSKALEAYEETLRVSRVPAEKAYAHYDIARTQFAQYAAGDETVREAAETHCRSAIKILPKCAVFWTLLGCTIERTLPNRRLWCVNKALELDPQSFASWCAQGWILLLNGQAGTAKMSFERAQSIVPSAPEPWLGRGMSLVRVAYGNMTYDAKSCFEQAYQVKPTRETALLSLVAQTFYQPRRYGDLPGGLSQRAMFVRAAYPEDPSALNIAALVLEELGDLNDALSALNQAGAVLPQEDCENVLEWVSGKNSITLVKEAEVGKWSLAHAYHKFRMVLTSKLRVICKKGEAGSSAAGDVAAELTELVPEEDVPHFESTVRALICHYLGARRNVEAERLLRAYLKAESAEPVSRDAVLAGVSLSRAHLLDDASAAHYLQEFNATRIADPAIARLAKFVEAIGSYRRNPEQEADLSLAQSDSEKLLMFKVLLEGGLGPSRVRYYDPEDNAVIEFRQNQDGHVYYSVSGEERPAFRRAVMGSDSDGSYIEMPDIDKCAALPVGERLTEVLPRLRRLLTLSGVRHNLAGGELHNAVVSTRNERRTQVASAQLLSLVRSVVSGGKRSGARHIANTVEVLYRFTLLLVSHPEVLSDSTEDIASVLSRCIAVLKRVSEEATTRDSILLFKARYALGLLLYAAPELFHGEQRAWEDVVQIEDEAEGAEVAQQSEEGAELPALQWCMAVVQDIAAEGYAEGATLLGLCHYAKGDYDTAIQILSKTLEEGQADHLDWSRWDVHQGIIYSHIMQNDWAAAQHALDTAAGTICSEKLQDAKSFLTFRKQLLAGKEDAAYATAEQSNSLACLMHAAAVGVSGPRAKPLQKKLLLSLPQGSFLLKNFTASFKVLESWNHLQKDAEGLPDMTKRITPASVPARLAEQAWNEWDSSVAGRLLCVLVGIISQAPTLSSSAIDSLRKDIPGVDSTPLLYYWLSSVRGDGVSVWESLTTLLKEVGSAAHNTEHLWFALRKVVETIIKDWPQLCPAVRQPDAAKLKGKEYREAVAKLDDQRRTREENAARGKRIAQACLEKLKLLRPESPYVSTKQEALNRLA